MPRTRRTRRTTSHPNDRMPGVGRKPRAQFNDSFPRRNRTPPRDREESTLRTCVEPKPPVTRGSYNSLQHFFRLNGNKTTHKTNPTSTHLITLVLVSIFSLPCVKGLQFPLPPFAAGGRSPCWVNRWPRLTWLWLRIGMIMDRLTSYPRLILLRCSYLCQ